MDVNAGQILNLLKKNLILILAISILFAGAAFGFTKIFIDNTYQSTVKFCVSTSDRGSGSISDDVTAFAYAQRLVNTYIELLQTNSFFTNVAKELGDRYSAGQLKQMVTFSSLNDTEVFQAQVIAKSQTEAKLVADTVAQLAPGVIANYNEDAELKVVDPAMVPQDPVAPNPVVNTAIGFVLGLLLSIAFVLIRNYFDIRINASDDITAKLGLPVLAYIPNFESVAKQNT